jgi:catechol 2,3-dioxygenase-like lactoylglutathione lyase family enzyme
MPTRSVPNAGTRAVSGTRTERVTVPPRFTGFSITTADRAASIAFYRALGFPVVEDRRGGGRSCVDAPNQHFDIDDVEAVPSWNRGATGPGIALGFEVPQRDDVDDVVGGLEALGYGVQQPPYDAAWGRRFAVVEDPDGNPVGIMSAG